jgi:hypothetical protein
MDTAPILSIYRTMTAPISIAAVIAALRALGGSAHQDAIVDLLAGSPLAKDEVAREVEGLLQSRGLRRGPRSGRGKSGVVILSPVGRGKTGVTGTRGGGDGRVRRFSPLSAA